MDCKNILFAHLTVSLLFLSCQITSHIGEIMHIQSPSKTITLDSLLLGNVYTSMALDLVEFMVMETLGIMLSKQTPSQDDLCLSYFGMSAMYS